MGTKRSIVRETSKGLPKSRDVRRHFQGVAKRDDRAYLTLSGKVNGTMFLSFEDGANFTHR